METEAPEFARTCAWTGQDVAGKHYILTSTEGQEIVSEEAFRAAPADTAAQLDYLTKAVNRLSRELGTLRGDKPAGAAPKGRPRKRAAAVPAQAGSAES
jgi:hypothetical protein